MTKFFVASDTRTISGLSDILRELELSASNCQSSAMLRSPGVAVEVLSGFSDEVDGFAAGALTSGSY